MISRQSLDDLALKVNRIPAIDRGGCCVLASMMLDALAHLGVPAEGIAYDWSFGSSLAQRSFGHVCISLVVDGQAMAWDNKGLFDLTDTYEILIRVNGSMTRDEVRLKANDWRPWNRAFHRESQIPQLRHIIRDHFGLPLGLQLGPNPIGMFEDDPE